MWRKNVDKNEYCYVSYVCKDTAQQYVVVLGYATQSHTKIILFLLGLLFLLLLSPSCSCRYPCSSTTSSTSPCPSSATLTTSSSLLAVINSMLKVWAIKEMTSCVTKSTLCI